LIWNQEVVKEILSFGKWILVSTALTFFAEQADRLILGKLLTLDVLGVYGVALTLADLPRSVTLALSGKVMFPAISKLTDQPRSILRAKVLKNRQPILWIYYFSELPKIESSSHFLHDRKQLGPAPNCFRSRPSPD
jgi:O-antigen/teichoic acid export membrane protein